MIKGKIYFLVGVMFISVFVALLGATKTYAASQYDDNIHLTDSLHLTRGSDTVEVTDADTGVLINDYCNNGVQVLADYNEARVSGSVAVTQFNSNQGTVRDFVIINYTQTPNASLDWLVGSTNAANVSDAKYIQLERFQNNYYCTASDGANVVSSSPTAYLNEQALLYYSTYDPNYPSNYEGLDIPENPDGNSGNGFTPKVGYTLFDDMRLTALPYNQNECIPTNLDGCAEPKYRYTILDGTDVIDTKVLLQSELYEYKYLDETKIYTFTVDFVHYGPPSAPWKDGIKINQLKYRIVGALGFQTGSPDINDCDLSEGVFDCDIPPIVSFVGCTTETFPFFDWDKCRQGFDDIINLLSFNFKSIQNQSINNVANSNPNSCYELQVLGGWIGRPGQIICPGFSETVRNTITPFVTFILGAIVFMYISRSKATVIS